MSQHESPDPFEQRLRGQLHAEAEQVRPRDGLVAIRQRTSVPARGRGWLLPVLSVAAAMAVVAVGVGVVRSTTDDSPSEGADVVAGGDTGSAQTVTAAAQATVWLVGDGPRAGGALYPTTVTVSVDQGEGLAAVETLLSYDAPPGLTNVWAEPAGSGQKLEVNSVEQADGVVTVDLTGPVQRLPGPPTVRFGIDPRTDADRLRYDPELFAQQLVRTVQSALDTEDPVLVTRDGEPVDRVLSAPVDQPVTADEDDVADVYVTAPDVGRTVVRGPLRVTGESDTFEANVAWRVRQGRDVVRSGSTMGGTLGERAPFEFAVRLPPGRYTVQVFDVDAARGAMQYVNTRRIQVR